jgi:ribosomal protein S6--L-glutamate ligase
MKERNIGLWLYQTSGGELVEKKLVAGLRERGIESVTDLNLRYADIFNGGIFCNDVRLDTLDLFLSYNAGEQSLYQVYLYEMLNQYIPTVNSFKGFSIASDRMKTNVALTVAGIPHVDCYLCHRDEMDKFRSVIGSWGRAIFKRTTGWGGMGTTLIESQADLDRLMPFLNELDIRSFYIEKFIDYNGTDYRVEVVDGEAIACYLLRDSDGDWCSNALSFGRDSIYGMNADMAELGVRAAKAVGLDIAAVDLLFDREREAYIVQGISAMPDFATPEQEALGLDFNDLKIAKIVDLIDRKTQHS